MAKVRWFIAYKRFNADTGVMYEANEIINDHPVQWLQIKNAESPLIFSYVVTFYAVIKEVS